MAGQAANQTRSEIAKRLNDLDCSKGKSTGSGEHPHGNDHYDQGKKGTKKKE